MLANRAIRGAFMAALFTMLGWATPPVVSAAEPEVITNSIGMKLVAIPAGEFLMGAEEDRADTLNKFPYCKPERLDGELPRHKVRITKPFYMGQYEVTLAHFLTFYHAANYKVDAERDGKRDWGYENGKLIKSDRFRPWAPLAWKIEMDHPVIYLSWNDAVAFCAWLSKKEGMVYRLPTEAEWEYTCRAGSSNRYHFGGDPEELIRYANAADIDRKAVCSKSMLEDLVFDGTNQESKKLSFPFLSRRDGYAWTAPIGKYKPNAFGLYDMHGNANEWCSDWFDEHYYEVSPTDDPQGPQSGSTRVMRGGDFYTYPTDLRCADRNDAKPSDRFVVYGFRVVRVR